MAAAHSAGSGALHADGIDLVDEDYAWRPLLGLGEHVAHAARADADEHLFEIAARHREEGHVGLARDRLGEKRLAGAGRPHEQHALRNSPAKLLECRRLLEELHDLLNLFARLVDAGDIRKRHLPRVGLDVQYLRLGLAEAERTSLAAHLAVEEPVHEAHHADEEESLHYEGGYRALVLAYLDLDSGGEKIVHQSLVLARHEAHDELVAALELAGQIRLARLSVEVADDRLCDLVLVEGVVELKLGKVARLGRVGVRPDHGEEHGRDKRDREPRT